jgi:hypothetical protein
MAAPHVAGAAALYLKTHPGAAWWQVRDALVLAGETLTQRCTPSAVGGACHVDSIGLHTFVGSEPILQVGGS